MKLKELRKLKHFKQEEVAKALNISQTGYSYYENGRNEPNIEMLIKLANLFNVSVDTLIGRETEDISLEHTTYQQELINKIKKLNEVECIKVDAFVEGLMAGKKEYQQEKLFYKYKGESK